jgi:hypothetical protein
MDKPILAPALLRELAKENPFGITLSMNDVQAWWDLTWLTYKTRKYRNHKRAIRSWWARATLDDLHRARLRKEIERMDRLDRAQEAILAENPEPNFNSDTSERRTKLRLVMGAKT